jgi:hypothetical protein
MTILTAAGAVETGRGWAVTVIVITFDWRLSTEVFGTCCGFDGGGEGAGT